MCYVLTELYSIFYISNRAQLFVWWFDLSDFSTGCYNQLRSFLQLIDLVLWNFDFSSLSLFFFGDSRFVFFFQRSPFCTCSATKRRHSDLWSNVVEHIAAEQQNILFLSQCRVKLIFDLHSQEGETHNFKMMLMVLHSCCK